MNDNDQAKVIKPFRPSSDQIGLTFSGFAEISFPHKKVKTWERKIGSKYLSVGTWRRGRHVPYGSVGTTIRCWCETVARVNRSRELVLDQFQQDFLAKLRMPNTGHYIKAVHEQIRNLSACSFFFSHEFKSEKGKLTEEDHYRFFEKRIDIELWSKGADQGALYPVAGVMSPEWYQQLSNHPMPYRLEHVLHLRQSSLATSFYLWLAGETFIASKKGKKRYTDYHDLMVHLGVDRRNDRRNLYGFRQNLATAGKRVMSVHPYFHASMEDDGIIVSHRGQPPVLPG